MFRFLICSAPATHKTNSFEPLSNTISKTLKVNGDLRMVAGIHRRPVARIFYGWVRSVDYTDQRAPVALFTRGVRGHAPPGNFEN